MPEQRLVEKTVFCRSPVMGEKGSVLSKWKFDTTRAPILALLTMVGARGVQASTLPDHISLRLSSIEKAKLGSIMWAALMVQHELQVSGVIEFIPGKEPPRLRLVRPR